MMTSIIIYKPHHCSNDRIHYLSGQHGYVVALFHARHKLINPNMRFRAGGDQLSFKRKRFEISVTKQKLLAPPMLKGGFKGFEIAK